MAARGRLGFDVCDKTEQEGSYVYRCAINSLIVALFFTLAPVVCAGDLDPPPGAVGPTMKTLDETEPRIPIRAADMPFEIDTPGSYYLVEEITTEGAGISIIVNNVTLDLKGFTLSGGTGRGIYAIPPRTGVVVRNGTVAGWAGDGIDLSGVTDARVLRVAASGNGGAGIRVGDGGRVEHCSARGSGGYGIETGEDVAVLGSTVIQNGSDGIHTSTGCRVTECIARTNGGNGIYVNLGGCVRRCTASSNIQDGIKAGGLAEVVENVAVSNTGDGIEVSRDCRVMNNTSTDNGHNGSGAGIHVTSADNRIENNHATDNDRGIDVDFGGNLILHNTASGNGTSSVFNYSISGGNAVGQIIDVTGGGAVAGVDPWANFSF